MCAGTLKHYFTSSFKFSSSNLQTHTWVSPAALIYTPTPRETQTTSSTHTHTHFIYYRWAEQEEEEEDAVSFFFPSFIFFYLFWHWGKRSAASRSSAVLFLSGFVETEPAISSSTWPEPDRTKLNVKNSRSLNVQTSRFHPSMCIYSLTHRLGPVSPVSSSARHPDSLGSLSGFHSSSLAQRDPVCTKQQSAE